MDEQKVIETIKMLRKERQECKEGLGFYGNNSWHTGLLQRKIEVCNTAIEALEKQLPKKPEMRTTYNDFDGRLICYKGFCPSCGGVVESYRNESCHHCAQMLDWSE